MRRPMMPMESQRKRPACTESDTNDVRKVLCMRTEFSAENLISEAARLGIAGSVCVETASSEDEGFGKILALSEQGNAYDVIVANSAATAEKIRLNTYRGSTVLIFDISDKEHCGNEGESGFAGNIHGRDGASDDGDSDSGDSGRGCGGGGGDSAKASSIDDDGSSGDDDASQEDALFDGTSARGTRVCLNCSIT